MSAILFYDFNPIAFSIGSIHVHWYGIFFSFSLLICTFLITKLCKINIKNKDISFDINSGEIGDRFFFYVILGVIICSRLGCVFFYGIDWLKDPIEVLKIYKGGLSFHGGIIGVIISTIIFAYSITKKMKTNSGLVSYSREIFYKKVFFSKYFKNLFIIIIILMFDSVCTVAPIGILFGRIANFLNSELYGRASDNFGIVFLSVDNVVRHPSQLYEAFLEGFVILIVNFYLFFKTNIAKKTGYLTGLFISMYSIARFICEEFREPDQADTLLYNITTGQYLSIFSLLIGVFFIYFSKKIV